MKWVLTLGWLMLATTAWAGDYESIDAEPSVVATITAVPSGSQVTYRTDDGAEHTAWFADCEAPMLDQPYGIEAQRALQAHLIGLMVRVTSAGKRESQMEPNDDLVRVFFDSGDACSWLVHNGLAWAHPYLDDRPPDIFVKQLMFWQQNAERMQMGLWALKTFIPPWDWRSGQRHE
jgi:endonuclease YncB( thermonuclease family)